MRMFSDTAVLVKIPSESENVSIIENDHVSPLKKRATIMLRKVGSHKRERNWKGGDAVLSCSVTVLIIEPCWGPRNHRMLTQRFCVLKLAHGIMLQIVLCL